MILLGYFCKKKSIRDISKVLDISRSSVHYTISRYKDTGATCNRPRSGRPRATSARDDRKMTISLKFAPKKSATAIASDLRSSGVQVCDETVRNRLRSEGYKGCIARCKPLIKSANRKKREALKKKYLNKTPAFWKKVLWTDETKVNLFQCDGKQKVWRKKNMANNYKHTSATVKHGGGSVMAWACCATSGTGSIVFLDDVLEDGQKTMDSKVYQKILSDNIKQNASKLIGRSFIMQADNDPKHTSKATKTFLEKKKWTVLDWPSQSPDLNPIEHLFGILKYKMKEFSPKNKTELKSIVANTWKSIPQTTTESLINSMPRRLSAVIDNKGYATKY